MFQTFDGNILCSINIIPMMIDTIASAGNGDAYPAFRVV